MPGRYDVHPEMDPLISAAASLPPADTFPEIRKNWEAYAAANTPARPDGLEVQDTTMPSVDGTPVPVRIYRPKGLEACAPCVIYYHGGGFVKGSPQSSDTTGWGLAMESRAVCVSVDYRLAPEHKYPEPFEDCYGVLCHIAANGPALGIDVGRLAVAGDSAGGNLAAAVALAARDKGGPKLLAQALIYPCLTDDLSAPSYTYNAEPPGLTRQSMGNYWVWYLGEGVVSSDPYATPLKAQNLKNLPPAFIMTAEYDPLYCDGVEYRDRLRAAGVPVTYLCAARLIHGFMRARLTGERSRAAFAAMTRFLRERFAL